MPYRRSYPSKPIASTKESQHPVRKRRPMQKMSLAQLAMQVKSLQKDIEYKVQDTGLTVTAGVAGLSTTPQVVLFNGLNQGDDYNERIGRQVKFSSIYQRISLAANTSAAQPHFVRYILFWYKDPSGAAPTPLQMFGSATPGVNSMLNLNVRKDFVILKDFIWALTPISGGEGLYHENFYLKSSQQTIYNSGNAGTIADIDSYALYAFIWTDTAASATESPGIQVQSRLRYTDN